MPIPSYERNCVKIAARILGIVSTKFLQKDLIAKIVNLNNSIQDAGGKLVSPLPIALVIWTWERRNPTKSTTI